MTFGKQNESKLSSWRVPPPRFSSQLFPCVAESERRRKRERREVQLLNWTPDEGQCLELVPGVGVAGGLIEGGVWRPFGVKNPGGPAENGLQFEANLKRVASKEVRKPMSCFWDFA